MAGVIRHDSDPRVVAGCGIPSGRSVSFDSDPTFLMDVAPAFRYPGSGTTASEILQAWEFSVGLGTHDVRTSFSLLRALLPVVVSTRYRTVTEPLV
jgi:hypothetical protein